MFQTSLQTTVNNDELSALNKASAWINSSALTPGKLKGKVVVVEFCTYTCINWLRTLPHVCAWAEKYKDKGLVVIAVHTPEFPFEKSIDNVRQAIHDRKIGFPVAIDNNQEIWKAFDNNYWPALYFIDAKGRVRYHQFGEGGYESSEKNIQLLLREMGTQGLDTSVVVVDGRGIEMTADWGSLNSSENYLGYERTENFSSRGGVVADKSHDYTSLSHLELNEWALEGDWTMKDQLSSLNKPNGRIVYRFHARDLHLVMGPSTPGTTVRFRILIDGRPPGTVHGTDVDERGNGVVTHQRLYQLVRQSRPIKDREFIIEFLDPGIEVFAITFG